MPALKEKYVRGRGNKKLRTSVGQFIQGRAGAHVDTLGLDSTARRVTHRERDHTMLAQLGNDARVLGIFVC